MRASILIVFITLALAQMPQPEKIVFARVFPQPGQIGLFLATADGSNQHPLLTPADIDYDASGRPMARRSCSRQSAAAPRTSIA